MAAAYMLKKVRVGFWPFYVTVYEVWINIDTALAAVFIALSGMVSFVIGLICPPAILEILAILGLIFSRLSFNMALRSYYLGTSDVKFGFYTNGLFMGSNWDHGGFKEPGPPIVGPSAALFGIGLRLLALSKGYGTWNPINY